MLIPVLMFACSEPDEMTVSEPQGEAGIYLTGMNKGLSYQFTSPNGRVVSSEDKVTNLVVFMVDEAGNIAYEQRFYPYYEGEIPDTIFIPEMSAGKYELMATTADYYNYWYYTDDVFFGSDTIWSEDGTIDPNPDMDTSRMVMDMLLPYYSTSQGPIYVGYESFEVGEEDVLIDVTMKNLSAKISFNTTSDFSFMESGMEMGLHSVEAMSYNLRTGEMIDEGYENYVYSWMGDGDSVRDIYVMPQSFKGMFVNYYDWYSGFNISQDFEFEQAIKLNTGDAITFTLDMQEILDGGGNGTFYFEEINWNDLGELTIP